MLSRLVQTLFVCALACSPAYAQTANNLDLATMQIQLQTIETELHTMALQLEDVARDIGELKECNALARQAPLSLNDLRKLAKPANKEDDSRLVTLFGKDTIARMNCGLTPKLN